MAHADRYVAWAPLREPSIDAAAYVRTDAIAAGLRDRDAERYAPVAFQGAHRRRGFLLLQEPQFWPLEANQRSMIFRIRDAGGYNPSQLVRYWTFVRAMDPKNITYNAAFLSGDASPAAFDLLQVGWMTAATASQDVPGFQYAQFAESLGLKGVRCETPDRIGAAWDAALTADRPCVVSFRTDPEVPPLPPHITFEQAKKFMTSLLHDPSRSAMIRDAMKQMLAAVKK